MKLMRKTRFFTLISFYLFLAGCEDPVLKALGISEAKSITVTADRSTGRYNPMPTAVEITFPDSVKMDTVAEEDFKVEDTCAAATIAIDSVAISGKVATVALNNMDDCVNSETVTLTLSYSKIKLSEGKAKGTKVLTYTMDTAAPTVSATIGNVSDIVASGAYSFSTVPTSATFVFSSDVDLASITAADLSIDSVSGQNCSTPPTIGTLTKTASTSSVRVALPGSSCADGEGFKLIFAQDGASDSTLDGSSGSANAMSAPAAALEIEITYYGSAPSVSGVGAGSTTADGTYKLGDVINIEVEFTSPVTVTGTPRLRLNLAGTRYATYASGSNSTSLIFSYTVTSGASIADLDYFNTSALQLNGGTISLQGSGGGVAAVLTLASPGASGSLGDNKEIAIDATAPTVTSSSPTGPTNTWGSGSRDITFTMSEEIEASSLADTDLVITPGTCSGVPTVTATSLGGGSSNIVTFTLDTNTCNDSETYGLSFVPSSVTDLAGNPGSGATRNIGVTTDLAGPGIVVGAPSETHVNSAGTVTYTVTYTDATAVTLSNGDLTLDGASTDCSANVSGSGLTTRTITITDCSDNGAVQLSIAAATATDGTNDASAVSEGSITDFEADNTPLTDPTDNFDTAGSNKIYSENTDTNFTLTFAGDTLGAQAAIASTFNLDCDAGSGANPVGISVTRTSATVVTVTPTEAAADFVYNADCSISSLNTPDAAGNTFSMTSIPFKVSQTPQSTSGPSGLVSLATATSNGYLDDVVFNIAMDAGTVSTSNVTFACDGQDIDISAINASGGDTTFTVDFDESDSDWTALVGGESCVLTFTTDVTNSIGEALATPAVFNFTTEP